MAEATASVDVSKVMRNVTVEVKVQLRGLRWAKMRMRLAVLVFRLGAWVAGVGFRLVDEGDT